MKDRLLIFAVALAVRLGLAWLFFGSVDTSNDFLNAARMFSGWSATQIPVPYFPGIQLLLWLGGVIAVYTPLPLTFPWKFFGAFFDAALAVTVYDYLAAHGARARRYAWLYVFAPVPLLIASIHGQRDAACIAFLLLSFLLLTKGTRVAFALAGACMVLSLIVKPIALPFLPLLFAAPWAYRTRERWTEAASIIGGALVAAIVYLTITSAAGAPVTPNAISRAFGYAGGGVQIFGFPFLIGTRPNRYLALLPLLVLIPAYWKGLVGRERVLLLAIAVIYGTAGIGPQYLMWIVPLLLVCGHNRFAAFYSLVAGWFLVIHYHHPGPTGFNMENLGAFAPLRGASWLAPVPVLLGPNSFLYVFLSSFLLPVSCLAFVAFQITRIVKTRPAAEVFTAAVTPARLLAPAIAGLAIVAIVSAWALSKPEPTVRQLEMALRAKLPAYEVERYRGPGLRNPNEATWVVPAYVANEAPRARAIDAVTIAYAWIVVWSAAAWMSDARRF